METNESFNEIHGPRITDGDFFDNLRDDVPALSRARDLFLDGNPDGAISEFAAHVREKLDTDRYFSLSNTVRKPEATPELIARAERVMSHVLVSCSTPMEFGDRIDWFANPTFNEYKEWTWQLSRHSDISALADAYRATGKPAYAEETISLLLSWIEQALVPDDDVHSHDTMCWRTIETGIRMLGAWPRIIHTLIDTPAFTDRAIFTVMKSVYEHARRLTLHYSHSNWLIMELCGMLNITVLFPFFKKTEEWRQNAIARFEQEILSQLHPEGLQFELSTNYHGVVLSNIRTVVELLTAYDIEPSQSLSDALVKGLDVYSRLLMSGYTLPDLNDGARGDIKNFLDPFRRYCDHLPWVKWIYSDAKEGCPPEFLSTLLPTVGFVSFRESWDRNAVTALFDGGKFGRSHQHEDKLNLLVYADGEPILVEGNNYAYDNSAMRKYVLNSTSHNVSLVDMKGQNRRFGFAWDQSMLTSVEPIPHSFGGDVEYAEATYDEGYGFEASTRATHTRRVTFVRHPHAGRPYFLVFDRYSSEEAHNYTALWHVDTEELHLSDRTAVCPRLAIMISDELTDITVVKGQEKPQFQGWTARTSNQGDYYAIPTLQATVSGREAQCLTLLLPLGDDGLRVTSLQQRGEEAIITYDDGYEELIRLNI